MANTIAEQLGGLPLVSTVLRVDFDLLDANSSFQEAQLLLRRWASKKVSDFGESVDWSKSSQTITSPVLSFEFAENQETFAFFLSHSEVGSNSSPRDWITQVSLSQKNDRAHVSMRLSIRQARNAQQPLPRAPKFISELVEKIGGVDVRVLELRPLAVHGGNFEDFDALLMSKKRTLPLLAISQDQEINSSRVDPVKLSGFLCGISHVAVLDPVASWMLTEKYGKERSTFRGAVRCYNPSYSLQDDTFQHKLWLQESISRLDAFRANGFLNLCLSHLFAVTTAQFAPYPLLTPSAVKRKDLGAPVLVLSSPPDTLQEVLLFDDVPIQMEEDSAVPEIPFHLTESDTLVFTDIAVDKAIKALEEATASQLLSKQAEIVSLEKQLSEARDETAQKNQELALLRPVKQEVEDLTDELKLLKGEYETKDSPVLAEFWASFNLFFEAARNLTTHAMRAEKQENELERAAEEQSALAQRVSQLEGKLAHKQRQIDSVLLSEKDENLSILFPQSWEELLKGMRAGLKYVDLPESPHQRLAACPFSESIAREVYQLLQVLDRIGQHTDGDGSLNALGLQIHQQNFVGDNAPFSDESTTNKRRFETDLTFVDPTDESATIFCPWHGKINQQQFRVHFEWARSQVRRNIKVAYVGPKVTKH